MSIANERTGTPAPGEISKGMRVRVIGTDKTGVVAAQRPDDEPFGSPPQRKVRPPLRLHVYDFDQKVDHGWFWWFELERYTRQPGDIPAHIEEAGRMGAKLLLARSQKRGL